MALTLESPSFEDGGAIPERHTFYGDDVSPPLRWRGEPEGTRSFALVVEDPDAPDPQAPDEPFVHWIVYDLPPLAHELHEDASRAGLPRGAEQGVNDWGRPGWGGPKPPIGRHRYAFVLYALDVALPVRGWRKGDLERAIDGHVLDRAELVGTYAAPRDRQRAVPS